MSQKELLHKFPWLVSARQCPTKPKGRRRKGKKLVLLFSVLDAIPSPDWVGSINNRILSRGGNTDTSLLQWEQS